MSAPGRIFVDVTYTRTQTGNVGITRAVRRLAAELRGAPVAYHRHGYRHVSGTPSAMREVSEQDHSRLASRGFRGVRLLALGCLTSSIPVPALRWCWALANRLTFNSLSANERPIAFAPGDLLVLADQSWNYPAWIAARSAAASGARVLLIVYDLIPLRHPQFCEPLFTDVFGRWLPRMLAASHAVLCISQATEKDFRAWCAECALPMPPTAHFRLGSDLPATDVRVRPRFAQFAQAPGPFFMAVGTIEPRKNLQLLLRALEQLWSDGSNARLLIVGRAHPRCRDLVRRMRDHPEQGRRLLNWFDATDAELEVGYTACRALVFPSLAEGFGLPLVEARTRGCPVIASDLPALSELADAGVFLFAPGDDDHLVRLLRQHEAEDLRAQVGRMPPFSWSDSARQCVGAVERLLTPTWKA
jgi:glycosyltransferase involved in cell wall biosynthesis